MQYQTGFSQRILRGIHWLRKNPLALLISGVIIIMLVTFLGETEDVREADPVLPVEPLISEGHLRVAINGRGATLDPHKATSVGERIIAQAITDSLFRYDAVEGVTGALVQDWEMDENGRTLRLTLRPDIVFTDGTPCDAAAVAFNLERMQEVGPPIVAGSWLNAVEEVEVIDQHTLLLRLWYHDINLLFNLSHPQTGMVSPRAVENLGDEFEFEPVGVGPFQLVWQTGLEGAGDLEHFTGDYIGGDPLVGDPLRNEATIHLEAYPEHYRGMPHLSQLTFVVGQSQADPLILMEMGFDVITEVPAGYQVSDGWGYTFERPRLDYHMVSLNLSSPHLQDVRVREALALAIDRSELVREVFAGDAHPLSAGETPLLEGPPSASPGPMDVERARQLLTEAGYVLSPGDEAEALEGTLPKLNLLSDDDRQRIEVSQRLADQIRRLGVVVNLEVVDRNEYYERMLAGDYDWSYWVLLPGLVDPSGYTANLRSDSYWNVSHMTGNEELIEVQWEVDRILMDVAGLQSSSERERLYLEFADLVAEHHLFISLWHTISRGVARHRVVDLAVPYDQAFDFFGTFVQNEAETTP